MKFNSKTFLFACLLLAGFAAHAQVGFQLGWEAGAGVSWLSGNKIVRQFNDPREGYSGGILGQIDFQRRVALRTGLMYDMQGSRNRIALIDEFGNQIGTFPVSFRFDLLTVPVLARVTFGKRLRYFAEAGPYASFILRAIQRSPAVGNLPAFQSNQTSSFKAAELGVASGLGLTFAYTDAIWLSCTLRANIGLSDASALPVFQNGALRTNAVNLMLGASYRFEVGKSRRTALRR